MSHTDRVIILVDMDCFYCQVEENLNPTLKGKPVAVVQYNAWRGGGIIAVNYQARDRGVTRHMRGNEAKQKCPEIELVRVPTVRGKADLTKYREAGKSVAKILQMFTPLLERASVDEAYLDITEAVEKRLNGTTKEITLRQIKNTHVVGCGTMDFLYNLYNSGLYVESNMKLAFGGIIAEEIRAAVFEHTGYTCSAGIAHNKILAKLASGLHKPNKQTILPQESVEELYKDLPVRKIQSLGGKFGNTLSEDLGITNMAELVKFTEKQLAKRYDEKTASFLYNIARGINLNPVTTRLVSKSIGCCKKFAGKAALVDVDSVKHWLSELALEIVERLENDFEENNRKAKQIVVGFSQEVCGKDVASSRTLNLNSYDPNRIAADAFDIIKKNCMKATGTFCLKFLGFNAGKFEDCRNVNEITAFFKVDSDLSKNTTKQSCNNQNDVKRGSVTSLICKEKPDPEPNSILEEDNFNELQTETNYITNFSDTTEELDENSSELLFFNENPIENGNCSDSDSISNELCDKGSNDSTENQPQKESFFLRYFENLKKQRTSPALRDFNTSRNLEELDEDENSDADIFADEQEPAENEPTLDPSVPSTCTNIYDMPGTSHDVFEFEDVNEVCKECGKKIPRSEMVSHMDYHFAIKIVREESKLYKKEPQAAQAPKQNKKCLKKSGKRKSFEMEKNIPLKTFLKMGLEKENSNDNTELCPQCNKRIDVENFASHLDYHAAKKLHLEINPVNSCSAENLKKSKSKRDGKTRDLKHNKNGVRSVTTFFKPVN